MVTFYFKDLFFLRGGGGGETEGTEAGVTQNQNDCLEIDGMKCHFYLCYVRTTCYDQESKCGEKGFSVHGAGWSHFLFPPFFKSVVLV